MRIILILLFLSSCKTLIFYTRERDYCKAEKYEDFKYCKQEIRRKKFVDDNPNYYYYDR